MFAHPILIICFKYKYTHWHRASRKSLPRSQEQCLAPRNLYAAAQNARNRYDSPGWSCPSVIAGVILYALMSWWRHQIETFSALLALCAGNSSVTGEFPSQRPVTQSFDVFFDLRLNKRLSKQSWGWWFETPPRSLWRHCNGVYIIHRCDVAIIVITFYFSCLVRCDGRPWCKGVSGWCDIIYNAVPL